MEKPTIEQLNAFLYSLEKWIEVVVSNATNEQEMDSLGTWHEREHARAELYKLFGYDRAQ